MMSTYIKNSNEYILIGYYKIHRIGFMSIWRFKRNILLKLQVQNLSIMNK